MALAHALLVSGTPLTAAVQLRKVPGEPSSLPLMLLHQHPGWPASLAGGSRRWLRRALRQNVPASEVFASTTSPLEAVAVTMNLQTNNSDAVRLRS